MPGCACWWGGETRGTSVCLPPPRKGDGCGAGEELGPTRLRAMTWAGTGFQTCKPQSAQSLLIPGPGERLQPAGEGLLWGDSGEVWRGACRDRLEAAGPGLFRQNQGPVSCPLPVSPATPAFLAFRAHHRSSITRIQQGSVPLQKGAPVQTAAH